MSGQFEVSPFPLKPIGQLVKINYGKGLAAKQRNPEGTIPVFGSNGVIGLHSESIAKAPTIIIGRKGSVGEVNFSAISCWPIDTSFYIDEYPENLDPKWLFYCLGNLQLGIHAQGPKPGIKRDLLYSTSIPIPEDINEQRRIVARIEELIRRTEELREVGNERENELDVLLQATYLGMIEDVEWVPLEQVASLLRRKIDTEPDCEYEEMGVRSFGKGTFKKPILTGQQVGNKRIYRIHEGDLVFNNVFAWEGAIAVAQEDDHGRVGSHRFITYVPHDKKATSEFLCHHFLSEKGIGGIRAASPGSAGRNRTLGLKKLEKIRVPVPDYEKQVRFANIAHRRRTIRRESFAIEQELRIFQASLLAKAFRGEL